MLKNNFCFQTSNIINNKVWSLKKIIKFSITYISIDFDLNN